MASAVDDLVAKLGNKSQAKALEAAQELGALVSGKELGPKKAGALAAARPLVAACHSCPPARARPTPVTVAVLLFDCAIADTSLRGARVQRRAGSSSRMAAVSARWCGRWRPSAPTSRISRS